MHTEQQEYIKDVYLQMYQKLVTYAVPRIGSMELAEEAVQETFRVACEKPEDMISSPNPRGWLMTTLKNVIRNMLRRRKTAESLVAEYLAAKGTQVSYTRDERPLEIVFHGLAYTEDFRLVKEMAIDGKSHLELARERGITVDACKKRMQRAKEKLMKILK